MAAVIGMTGPLGLLGACQDAGAPTSTSGAVLATVPDDVSSAAAKTWTVQSLPPLPGGVSASGYRINTGGDVAGWSEYGSGPARSAVLWIGTTVKNLGVPFGTEAVAYDVNDSRTVVGESGDLTDPVSERRAFIWKGGVFTIIPTATAPPWLCVPPATCPNRARAEVINKRGEVAGVFTPLGVEHAFRYTVAGQLIDLHPPGYIGSTVRGISDNGVIVGTVIGSNNVLHAASWSAANVFTLLVANAFPYTEAANDVNSAGVIVGESGVSGSPVTGAIWRPASGYQIIPPPQPFFYAIPRGISDRGRVAAEMWTRKAGAAGFLPWVPVPQLPTGTALANGVNRCGSMSGVAFGPLPVLYTAVRWTISACD
jgi:uncharacterized membrane protein